MKEQLPPPDFDANRYERPNQNWICGHASQGHPCRVGPDNKGRCRATFECQPLLELKEGQTIGRYRCTRSAQHGGPCDLGPLPDGTCRRPVPKCNPVRSLRARRGIVTMCVIVLTVAVLLIALSKPFRGRFISPGPLSAQHGTATFAAMAAAHPDRGGNACTACHQTETEGPNGWVRSAMGARPGPLQIRVLASAATPVMTSLDQKCLVCHSGHSFHQPNVAEAHSCSICHQEHHGPGPMSAPVDANCLSCHANSEAMETSLVRAKSLPAGAFDYRPEKGRVLFKAPRPERGYTKIIHSFASDHPEFQILAEKMKDADALKFNHQLHLTTVLLTSGKKMTCAECHKPDAAGVYHLKITYEQNCKNCHKLQFDVNNPDLPLPHGDAAHVRDFLRSLSAQYADFGANQKKIIARRELETFVQEQLKQVSQQSGDGEALERRVFFGDARNAPVARIGDRNAIGPAQFPGCAYCHMVSDSGKEIPQIAKPVIPDRWLIRGRFDHSKHFKVACITCHDAEHSRETSDVLLPSKSTCVKCHSPSGGVANNCSTCHGYHSPTREDRVLADKR